VTDDTKLTIITVCAVIVAANCAALSVGVAVFCVGTWYDGLSPGDQITARYNLTAISVLASSGVAVFFLGAMDICRRGRKERRRRDRSWAMGIWTKGRREGERRDHK
jgi:hypothetical protein